MLSAPWWKPSVTTTLVNRFSRLNNEYSVCKNEIIAQYDVEPICGLGGLRGIFLVPKRSLE